MRLTSFYKCETNLSASYSAEDEHGEQDQQNNHANGNKKLRLACAAFRFDVFWAREASNKAPGESLHDGEGKHSSRDFVNGFNQEICAEYSLDNIPACLE